MWALGPSAIRGASNLGLDELGCDALIVKHLRADAFSLSHHAIQHVSHVDPRLAKRTRRLLGVGECQLGARRKRPVEISADWIAATFDSLLEQLLSTRDVDAELRER